MSYNNLQHDRHWVFPHWTGNYVVRVNPVGGISEEARQATRRALFVLLHDCRSGNRHAQRVVRDIYGALSGNGAQSLYGGLYPDTFAPFAPPLGSPREPEQSRHMADAVERAAMLGQLSIVLDVRPVTSVIAQPDSSDLGSNDTVGSEPSHFIELELVDQDELPVPGEAYSIKLPDGRTVTGRLDNTGRATVTGIKDAGSCQVSFPNLDVSVWE